MHFNKTLLVIFLSYLLVTDEAEAFWGFLAKLATKVVPSLFGSSSEKSKREIENFFEPYQKDLDLELDRFDRFLSKLDLN